MTTNAKSDSTVVVIDDDDVVRVAVKGLLHSVGLKVISDPLGHAVSVAAAKGGGGGGGFKVSSHVNKGAKFNSGPKFNYSKKARSGFETVRYGEGKYKASKHGSRITPRSGTTTITATARTCITAGTTTPGPGSRSTPPMPAAAGYIGKPSRPAATIGGTAIIAARNIRAISAYRLT